MSGHSSGRRGQIQVLAAIAFLFLIPTTVIIAQNATNSSLGNLSLEGNLIATVNASDSLNQTPLNLTNVTMEPPENQTSETNSSAVDEEIPSFALGQTINGTPNGSLMEENFTEANVTEYNGTLPGTNQTANESVGTTGPVNGTEEPVNETAPDETGSASDNMTEPLNETETLPSGSSHLTVSISGPDKITRGDDAVFFAEIINSGNGTAFHVTGFWKLPDMTGMPAFGCDDLGPGESCIRELVLPTTPGSLTGIKEIMVEVGYDG